MSRGKTKFSKNSIVLLAITAAIAFSLSLVSFQYSSFTSNEILKIAANDIRSNARIQAHDLERVMVHRLDSIGDNLGIIANAPNVQNNEFESARILFNNVQDSTSDLTDFYMWLDSDGGLVWISNANQTTYESFRGTDLSYRPYFTQAKIRLGTYYSSAIDSNDNVVRIYISRPIVSEETGVFAGAVVAAIRLDTFGTFLQSELSPDFLSAFGMVDRFGVILYSQNQAFLGKSIFSEEVQSAIPAEIRDSFNNFIRRSLQGDAGIGDFTIGGNTTTLAYEPILVEGEQFGTLYVTAQHRFAENVSLLVDQQRNFSTIMAIVIGGAAISIAALVLVWNARLERVVTSRTVELRTKSEELKRSYDSLASANEQLKVHDRLQKEFINVAAHELRTPTQAILGYSELLQMDPEDREEMIEAIYRNSLRLQRLTSDILDVTRIESEALRIDKEQFNLKDVILGAMQDAKSQLGSKVRFAYRPEDIYLQADRGRITQVVANLLDNAVKFTKEGTITISAERKDSQVIVTVRDTGTGVDSDIMPRLFSKFATKSEKGTGLGLFISRSIIEAHDGRIWCESSPGRGAIFAFSLPASET
ncbi:MAG TPA: sensor histidine kinase [Nitrososphaera sp.]|nr:sensor histidine kinase [Nitrososphaera sp.]